MRDKKLVIDGTSLTLGKIEYFLNENPRIVISPASVKRIKKTRNLVDRWVKSGESIYGVTTGFGEFSNVSIPKEDIRKLQENLILSHAVGCGDYLPPMIVKIMMLLRLNALARGYSGIRLQTLELLIEMMHKNIIPAVPSQGSVGSSGDLVQLSHLVLAMIGKGNVQLIKNITDEKEAGAKLIPSAKALKKFKLSPVKLEAKEGLALINGTQMMTAFASYISIRAAKLVKLADISAALSHEAIEQVRQELRRNGNL